MRGQQDAGYQHAVLPAAFDDVTRLDVDLLGGLILDRQFVYRAGFIDRGFLLVHGILQGQELTACRVPGTVNQEDRQVFVRVRSGNPRIAGRRGLRGCEGRTG